MTREQAALLKADQRRHQALAKYSQEPCLKELHNAIAEALGAAVEDWEVRQCKSETKSVSCRVVLARTLPKGHSREKRRRRLGR